jgi:hypothetical protein
MVQQGLASNTGLGPVNRLGTHLCSGYVLRVYDYDDSGIWGHSTLKYGRVCGVHNHHADFVRLFCIFTEHNHIDVV